MLDANNLFEPVTGTAITASADSTNTLDMLVNRDVGAGAMLEIHVQTLQAFTAAGAATLQISLQGSTDNATFNDILVSPVYPKASLVAGIGLFRYTFPVYQLNETAPGRYYKLRYTVATGPFTAGKLTAYLTGMFDRNVFYAYPRNFATDF